MGRSLFSSVLHTSEEERTYDSNDVDEPHGHNVEVKKKKKKKSQTQKDKDYLGFIYIKFKKRQTIPQ